ncbi:hypothetical protein WJX84_000058 [Apatococcus fuscideae]|uniref:GST N-terminal domain-containing protein n=1 Tax=Apatococcus fuscideae TaxID=2026836 RepID=A0AAW1T8T3_9CHLO
MASAGGPLYEAWVKGDPTNKVLGDCPFCHRVLLTLEEKELPYRKEYVDFAAKPEWLFSVNKNGSVPVVKDLSTENWLFPFISRMSRRSSLMP